MPTRFLNETALVLQVKPLVQLGKRGYNGKTDKQGTMVIEGGTEDEG